MNPFNKHKLSHPHKSKVRRPVRVRHESPLQQSSQVVTKDHTWSPPSSSSYITIDEEKKEENPGTELITIPKSFIKNSGFAKALTRPIKCKLFSQAFTTVSAGNTALSQAIVETFNSTTFPEIASYSALYDECRILHVKVHYFMFAQTASASQSILVGGIAVSFDPTVAAPTTLVQVLQEAHTTGGLLVSGYIGTDDISTILTRTPHVLSVKTPSPLAPITSSDVPGSAWFAVDGGTAPTLFVVRYYAPAGGAGCTIAIIAYLELDAEFRLRV